MSIIQSSSVKIVLKMVLSTISQKKLNRNISNKKKIKPVPIFVEPDGITHKKFYKYFIKKKVFKAPKEIKLFKQNSFALIRNSGCFVLKYFLPK